MKALWNRFKIGVLSVTGFAVLASTPVYAEYYFVYPQPATRVVWLYRSPECGYYRCIPHKPVVKRPVRKRSCCYSRCRTTCYTRCHCYRPCGYRSSCCRHFYSYRHAGYYNYDGDYAERRYGPGCGCAHRYKYAPCQYYYGDYPDWSYGYDPDLATGDDDQVRHPEMEIN